jgi:hypothetical protein
MNKCFSLLLACLSSLFLQAQTFTQEAMQAVYDEVKTPYKYGLVVAPTDNHHKIDCPTVFRKDGKWWMTYVIYNGSDGLDGRGYTTHLSVSDDLLHWRYVGCLLDYGSEGWDMNQRGGFPALVDWSWGGSYELGSYKGKHYMTYIGGHGTGYEAVREPLEIGLAWNAGDVTQGRDWHTADAPLMGIHTKDAQWWEKLVQYKSTVYYDKDKTLGRPFVMFYNAGGLHPNTQLKAERIGIALSSNMKDWRRLPLTTAKRQGNPVFYHETPGIITGDAQIVSFPGNFAGNAKAGDKQPLYVMFYFSAYNPSRPYNAYNTFAVSRDLLHWQEWDGADLIVPSKDYDNMFAHKSYVVKHDGVVYHFYCAVNTAGQRGIAVATSVPMGRSEVRFPTPEKKGPRSETLLDRDWTVRFLSTTEDSITSKMGTMKVSLPNNLDDYYGYRQLRHGNLHGSAVYSRTFSAAPKAGRRYFLEFQGVGSYATVTVNGHRYPKTLVGRTTYTLNVTDALRQGDNDLQVLVEHPAGQTASPWVCGGCSSEQGFSEGSQPFGIYRPVNLVETADLRVEPFGVHVWNNAACDSLFIDTEIKNYGSSDRRFQLVNKLALASGKAVFRITLDTLLASGQTVVLHQAQAVKDVHRWNLDDPYLYTLTTMLKDTQGKTVDLVATPYGIRSISWPVHRHNKGKDPGNFLLNGRPVFINGTCDYEHLFGASHAFSEEQIRSRMKLMRQAGFNAFREAHQPHNLLYQHLCDEQGTLFWSQFSAHIWYDTPEFRKAFKEKLVQWVKERRNSPSIVLWGLQNESVLPADFARECSDLIRELDPTCANQRAITTCNGGEGTDWNVVQNWSGTYSGDPTRYGQELKQPDELLNGEYGAWRTLGLHGNVARSEEQARDLLALKAQLAESVKDSVCGHFQWIFVSHDNPGRTQPDESVRRIDKVGPLNHKGLLTSWEQPTELYYWYQDHYAKLVPDTLTPMAADRNVDLLRPAQGYTYLYRVNCGGDAYTDSYGQQWLQDSPLYSHSWADRFGLPSAMASQGHIDVPIHGTVDAPLFQRFRWGRHELGYHFAVPNGKCRVELYFVEPWLGAHYGAGIDCEGERIFSVAVNGDTLVRDFDVWAEAGYAGACRKVVETEVVDGQLTIGFPEVKAGQAVLAAVAVATPNDNSSLASWQKPDLRGNLPATYWAGLDRDTLARYPRELLPAQKDGDQAVRYEVQKTRQTGRRHLWTVHPGVGREYALRFRYKNISGKPQPARLRITDAHGRLMLDREISFPATPNKFKLLSTTTGGQINAGSYKVELTAQRQPVTIQYLEMQ